MGSVLRSPRLRRRLLVVGILAGGAAIVAVVVALIPSTSPPSSPPVTDGQSVQPAAVKVSRYVSPRDRRAIDATLDRFVPAAVDRESAAVAWSLAGPELKFGSTLAQWRAGTSQVVYYPVKPGTSFHDWTTIEADRNTVTFNLLLHAKPAAKLGDYVFEGQMIRRGSQWLVNRWYTLAIMNPVRGSTHEIGPADFQAPGPADGSSSGSTLGGVWLLPIAGLLALALIVPLGLGLIAFGRAQRLRRAQVAAGRNELPPLPSSFRRR